MRVCQTMFASSVSLVPALLRLVVNLIIFFPSEPRGEACPTSLVPKLWRPGRRITNTYGPTETTVSLLGQSLCQTNQ